MLIVLILLYIQVIYTYNITVDINSSNIPEECLINGKNAYYMSKSEVLSNTEYKARQYYCNQDSDICVVTGKEKIISYIEFKDKIGNLKKYIAATCPYTNDITKCYGKNFEINNSDDYVYCSYKCTKNSDCLYNKCINNVCVYNENSSIIHCEDIYTHVFKYFDHTYVHCGKPQYESCLSDGECSSKICNLYCKLSYIDPYEYKGNTFTKFIIKCFIITPILVFIFICVYSFICHNKKYKNCN